MKKLFILLVIVAMSICAFAQLPQKMSYQAVIRDAGSALITSHAIGMRISILQGSATGTPVYVETQTPNTNANGLATIEIGGGIPVIGTFAGIDWSIGVYFIKTEIDPTGGTSYTITGTSQLLSVPYALHAKTAETITAHYIGESYGGGIVFYVYDNGQHGLIAATADLSTGLGWTTAAFQATLSNAVRDGVNGGLTNTERIIIQAGAGSYAAQLCANYKGGSYANWYLPSKYELNLLYAQKILVGGFAADYYWSSTEDVINAAWLQNLYNGIQVIDGKSATHYVRAIRTF